jgi:hypothetical protein
MSPDSHLSISKVIAFARNVNPEEEYRYYFSVKKTPVLRIEFKYSTFMARPDRQRRKKTNRAPPHIQDDEYRMLFLPPQIDLLYHFNTTIGQFIHPKERQSKTCEPPQSNENTKASTTLIRRTSTSDEPSSNTGEVYTQQLNLPNLF